MHPQAETAEMVKQCGQESSPEDAVIDAALETCLAEHANNLILPMLQSLSTEEKSLSGGKMKSAVWSGQHSPTKCNWIGVYSSVAGCYNCGGLDHHAKECSLPPQPKKCHYCQSIMHMVANCPHKTVSQQPTSSQGRHEAEPQPSTSAFLREGGGTHGYSSPSYSQEGRSEISERSGRSPQEASSSKLSASPEEPSRKGPSVQKRKKT
ncbi:protein lin-28 homolog B isoform 1-T1 [Morphnus guianensis]